jgi:hypothetical protein
LPVPMQRGHRRRPPGWVPIETCSLTVPEVTRRLQVRELGFSWRSRSLRTRTRFDGTLRSCLPPILSFDFEVAHLCLTLARASRAEHRDLWLTEHVLVAT